MRRRPILDFYERTCVDCGEPLYLYYQGPLSKSQSLWVLTDAAQEWIDQYPESGIWRKMIWLIF